MSRTIRSDSYSASQAEIIGDQLLRFGEELFSLGDRIRYASKVCMLLSGMIQLRCRSIIHGTSHRPVYLHYTE